MLANTSKPILGRLSRLVLSSNRLNLSTNTAYLKPEQQASARSSTPADVSLDVESIEAARQFERAQAQDAADAATFGNIRVLPAASPKYHRICEMHSD
ncbi:hypothetical protein EV183_004676 [Coemansia sp. RSA 2336]|nr:hypothetical protein EV183_004676 [Coemansia sp. RSA 2336]